MNKPSNPNRVTRKQATAAAKRLANSSGDFKAVVHFLTQRSALGSSPFSPDSDRDTYRKIGRQEIAQILVDLINGKTAKEDEQ